MRTHRPTLSGAIEAQRRQAVLATLEPAPPMGKPDFLAKHYREALAHPGLIVFKDEKQCWIAFVNEEPASLSDWRKNRRDLGHGGNGFVLVGFDGEWTTTHNLWSLDKVKPGYEHLFEATHKGYHRLSLEETTRYFEAKVIG